MVRRAPAVDLVFGPQTYHRLGQFMARLDAGERQVVETALPTQAKFAHLDRTPAEAGAGAASAARHGVRHRAGRLRQVLHLLRGALYARRGGLAPGRADRRRSAPAGRARRARGDAARAERQRLARRGPRRRSVVAGAPARSSRGHRGHRAAALHHQPSARHGRRADRRARDLRADALPASAGAVGLRPGPQRHEPQAHRRDYLDVIGRIRARQARYRAVVGLHRRLSRARPTRILPEHSNWSKRSASPRPIRSSIPRVPARRRRSAPTRCPNRPRPSASPRSRAFSKPSSNASTRRASGASIPSCWSGRGGIRASSSAARPICRRFMLPRRNTAPESAISCRSASIVLADTASLPILWVGHE
jgi:hypothetical protein